MQVAGLSGFLYMVLYTHQPNTTKEYMMENKETTPAIIRLMQHTDLSLFLNEGNLGLFTKLEAALIEDGKAVVCFGGYQESFGDISNTEDLYDNQSDILSAMITAWAKSVLGDFVKGLNDAVSDSLDIATDTSGGVYCMMLEFSGLDDYINDLDEDNAGDVAQLLNEWENSSNVIINIDELKSALQGFLSGSED